jgi:hypothetical protein
MFGGFFCLKIMFHVKKTMFHAIDGYSRDFFDRFNISKFNITYPDIGVILTKGGTI